MHELRYIIIKWSWRRYYETIINDQNIWVYRMYAQEEKWDCHQKENKNEENKIIEIKEINNCYINK